MMKEPAELRGATLTLTFPYFDPTVSEILLCNLENIFTPLSNSSDSWDNRIKRFHAWCNPPQWPWGPESQNQTMT